jgi:DNA-binding SARP family transcriptional activator/predicted ATPase
MVAPELKSTEGLRLRLIGVPEVSLNGVALTFSRRRAFALLVYLAVTGHVHTRDVLATLLSGDASDWQARKRLSNALAELRQLVGDYVITTRVTAAFNTSLPFWMDVRAFRQALAAGMEEEGLDGLEAALDLYQDEFLSGLTVSEASGFDEWVMLQGEALRTQAVQALQTIVARAMRTRADAQGVTAARRLVSLEPLLEDAHRQLMTFLARVGQRQEALAQYETCRSILEDELGEEPSPETVALYHRLKMVHTATTHGLLARGGPCLGREVELGVLTSRLVEPECRLITVVGLGGSGKSHLALEAAHRLADSPIPVEHPFADGIYFVPLDGIPPSPAGDNRREVLRRVVEVVRPDVAGEAPTSTDPTRQLQAVLKSKTVLLVLDGADQVPRKEARIAIELLLACPQVTLLITSRQPLQLPGEYVLTVGDLQPPVDAGDLEHAPAGRMVLMEAERKQLGFALRDEDRQHVMRLCHLAGGLPVALMLVAHWLPRVTPEDLVKELECSLDLLVTTDPRINARHRDMRALLAESWETLSENEQQTMRRLSVFHDGFDSTAARDVAACSVQHMTRLVDAGLVARYQQARYRLPELVRRYAYQRLTEAAEEAAATQERHGQYYARLVQELTESTRSPREAWETVRTETNNIRAAWGWAIAQGAWKVLGRLSDGLSSSSYSSDQLCSDVAVVAQAVEALRPVANAAESSDPELSALLVRLLCQEASLLLKLARYGQAEHIIAEASALAQGIEDPAVHSGLSYFRGLTCSYLGQYASAKESLDRALCLARKEGLTGLEVDSLLALGRVTYALGDAAHALELMQRTVAGYRDTRNAQGEGAALTELGRMAIEQGDPERGRLLLDHARRLLDETGGELALESALLSTHGLLNSTAGHFTEADECYTRALQINRQIGWREAGAVSPILGECGSLISLGRSARTQGDPSTARTYLSQALSVCQDVGTHLAESAVLVEMSLLAHVEGDDERGRQLANQALSILDRGESCVHRRAALIALGHAEFALCYLKEAAAAYSQALILDGECGSRGHVIESTADLARVSLAEGDRLHAASLLESIIDDLLAGNVSAMDEPTRAYLAAYEILHSIGDARDAVLLDTGCRLLQQRTAGIPDVMKRLLFLQQVAADRHLLNAHSGNGFHGETISRVSSDGDSQPA